MSALRYIIRHRAKVPEIRLTIRADKVKRSHTVILRLKYYVLSPVCTIGAYAVHRLVPLLLLAQLQNEGAALPLRKLITREFVVSGLLFIEFIKQLSQLQLKLRIRECRICYLRRQLRDSRFEVTIASRLRFLEKTLDGSNKGHPAFRRLQGAGSDLRDLLQGLDVEFTQFNVPQSGKGSQ